MHLTFRGAGGDYTIEFDPESGSYEDRALSVTVSGRHERWLVRVDDIGEEGCRRLGGLTHGYWYELVLADVPRVNYWGNGILLWTDRPRLKALG